MEKWRTEAIEALKNPEDIEDEVPKTEEKIEDSTIEDAKVEEPSEDQEFEGVDKTEDIPKGKEKQYGI